MLTHVSYPDKFGPDAEANAAVDAYNAAIVEAVAKTERPITPWYGLAWAAVPGDDLVHLDRRSLDYAGNVSLKKPLTRTTLLSKLAKLYKDVILSSLFRANYIQDG